MNLLRKRSYFNIIIKSAEPREPYHFATLFGYGARTINPYMVNEIICVQVREGFITDIDNEKEVHNFNKAIGYGILKIMNKIEISTLHSYRGSQIFKLLVLTLNSFKNIFHTLLQDRQRYCFCLRS
jgi:glutamate synthase (ferredoxin)